MAVICFKQGNPNKNVSENCWSLVFIYLFTYLLISFGETNLLLGYASYSILIRYKCW